jgi:DNA-binding response OmpR family regulator
MSTKKKLLVVEDDADVRLGYKILLTAHNYDVVFATDSISAVSEARKHQPDLVILDLGLPAGDGFIVLERFGSNVNPSLIPAIVERFGANIDLSLIPVIVVSGRDVHANRERAFLAGAGAFLQKPWNDNELLAIISNLIAKSGSAISESAVAV